MSRMAQLSTRSLFVFSFYPPSFAEIIIIYSLFLLSSLDDFFSPDIILSSPFLLCSHMINLNYYTLRPCILYISNTLSHLLTLILT